MSYTAIGEQVGLAQRMESVAPPGGVMLSDSTARLVRDAVVLTEPESIHIKGSPSLVTARRLLAVARTGGPVARNVSILVGRDWEVSTFEPCSTSRSTASVASSVWWGHQELARAAWQVRSRRSPRTGPSRCSRHNANRTRALGPLDVLESTASAAELSGLDDSVAGLVAQVAARVASECSTLLESMADHSLPLSLFAATSNALVQARKMTEGLRLAQRAIELADGDPAGDNTIVGSPRRSPMG
jgi:hypothetical protein